MIQQIIELLPILNSSKTAKLKMMIFYSFLFDDTTFWKKSVLPDIHSVKQLVWMSVIVVFLGINLLFHIYVETNLMWGDFQNIIPYYLLP